MSDDTSAFFTQPASYTQPFALRAFQKMRYEQFRFLSEE
jgi:hypothetical protein